MIKNFAYLSVYFFIVFFSLNLHGQNQTGIITYRGTVNKKFVDSFLVAYEKKERPMAIKQRVIDAMRNAESEEFILNFKGEESYYYNKPNLKQDGSNMGSRAGLTPYYTNNAMDSIIEMTRSLGNIAIKPLNWNITNKTKNIGDYKCYQATVKEKHYSRRGHYYYKDVIAWFTPEIPLNFGPKYYKGLPGLILQIEDREYTLTAIKINLNPSKDAIKIQRLKKNDKVITQEESYNRIKEMQDYRKKSISNNR